MKQCHAKNEIFTNSVFFLGGGGGDCKSRKNRTDINDKIKSDVKEIDECKRRIQER